MSTIINNVLLFFGINGAPTTVQDLLWDLIIIFVGCFICKWITIAIFSLMKQMITLY